MKIAVCDDMNHINILENLIYKFKKTSVECDAYTSGEELVYAFRDRKEWYDVIFLDMEMEQINGIETANHIRELDEYVIIVFVTSHTEYMRESFKCSLFRFLVKPIDEEEFERRNKMIKEETEMRIAICDDERNALKQIVNTVNNVFHEMNIQHYIDEYTNASELVQCKKQYDMIFLDIELKEPEKNGVWAAKLIKQKNPDCIIVFTTNHEEYIDEVIERYAFRYWSKPIDEYRLKKSMQIILSRMQAIKIELYGNKNNIDIPLRNIIYITPNEKHCKIVTIMGEYIATKSFKEIKERLAAKNFCECHGSYYVNLNYVERYSKMEVCLRYKSNKYKVHMSRRQYPIFKERMFVLSGEKL